MTKPVWLLSFLAAGAFGQTAPKVEFEVASIKPSPPLTASSQVTPGVHLDGAQLRVSYFNLRDYLTFAFQVQNYQISIPDGLIATRYEVNAKLPEGTPRDKVPEMVQALLIERFQIKFHREKKDLPVYALVVTKGGLKLKETPTDAEAEAQAARGNVSVAASGGPQGVAVNLGNGSFFSMADNKMTVKKMGMDAFAQMLSRFTDRPVLNQTSIAGNYDFSLDFAPEDFRAMHIRSAIAAGVSLPPEALRALEASGESMFSALNTVGLKLELRKAPIDFIVIDSASKTPTEN